MSTPSADDLMAQHDSMGNESLDQQRSRAAGKSGAGEAAGA